MKRIIIVEGDSEESFVNEILLPYFQQFGVYDVRATRITTRKGYKGGFVNYHHLANDINRVLKGEKEVVVSTFVDFFRLPKKNFPNSQECFSYKTSDSIIDCLEDAMAGNINDNRFVPYIQKHELEALLFASNKGFEEFFTEETFLKTKEVVETYSTPEDINTAPEGAPSKRLLKINPEYDKKTYTSLIADAVGIETILQKCPRFNAWVQKLIEKTKSNTN